MYPRVLEIIKESPSVLAIVTPMLQDMEKGRLISLGLLDRYSLGLGHQESQIAYLARLRRLERTAWQEAEKPCALKSPPQDELLPPGHKRTPPTAGATHPARVVTWADM